MSNAAGGTTFSITGTKRYVPVATLLTDDNSKLLKQLKSGFKWTNTWNKYQLKLTKQSWNEYLDYLIELSFQGVNKLINFLFNHLKIVYIEPEIQHIFF